MDNEELYGNDLSTETEEREYEQDLKNLFSDITGYDYNFKKQELTKKDKVIPKFCPKIANQIIGLVMKSMTKFTRYTKNDANVIGLKTTENIKSLWMLYYSNFAHDCTMGSKTPGECIRQYNETQINVILIDPVWRVVDDSYRHSIAGFTRKERNKTYQVTESRNVSLKNDKERSWFRPKNTQDDEGE